MSTQRRRSVIDELDKTRQEHPHPPTSDNAPLSRVGSKDVTDEILEQSEAVHIPHDDHKNNHKNSNYNNNNDSATGSDKDQKDRMIGLSTTATLPSSTWQPLASMSSNQLPSSAVLPGHGGQGYGAQDLHDKPSVLPEILPGFKDRMADIHHATLKSVSDVNPSSSPSSHGSSAGAGGEEGGKWTGGTMFPTMTPTGSSGGNGGFKTPLSSGSVSQQQHHPQQQRHGSTEEETNRKIARSSILYESADLEESTSSLTDDDPHHPHYNNHSSAAATTHEPIRGTSTSSTLVQGGQGGRRWSHELSPEKAGLVGSVLSVAGLVKDVVLDKIQQLPPTSSSSTAAGAHRHPLTADEKKEIAAGVAFGGSEESGDQTILLDGLLNHHQNQEAERAAAVAAAASGDAADAEELLKAAPGAAKEHQKSIFHLAANPETKKNLLLNHPESLGYHPVTGAGMRDQQLIGDSTLATALGVQHQRSAGGQDLSKTSR
ncbi:hypothetical protein K457DRAFT_122950 [Linnemannia elongata AG-77]|uniref:Uncharacterized protein n=1 Tax=Linnemannia elongata AG-77 TaxID=1314771 RepID=A0A197K5K1_9FUNG|nr:hypothetical protein K457DRAFT_122950 [Linnemannia elongata AG-77]